MPDPPTGLLRVCVIATPVGDDADRALDALLETVSERLPMEAVRAWKATDETAPSFAELHACDVALVCGRRMPLRGEALARIQWYCERGRPLLALSAGGGPTFARWPRFDAGVLGVEAEGTLTAGARPWQVEASVEHHPISADIAFPPFAGSLPEGIRLADDTDVLLTGRLAGEPHPVGWVRRRGTARVFATALGQLEHLTTPAVASLVSNAFRWIV